MTPPNQMRDSLSDRYTLERELGRGGMATVYLAEDVRHRRRVALKVLHPELSAVLGPERFLQEIELTANLQHPHILPLFDSGSAAGQLFYVMPFVEGETLRTRLERETQLPVDDALRIAREVADALTYAHERGVIHRDIKPENILLQSGHALVADFGIALAVQQAGAQRMTQTGLSLGTPQYMAPEQAMGDKAVDHRADIYALGAVIYEMLSGEPPHTGPSAQAVVAKVLTEPVRSVRIHRPAVPAEVDAALQVALEKLPADRFASVREFSETLRGGTGARKLTARAPAATAAPAPAGRRAATVGAAAVLVAAGLGLGWMLGRSRSPAEGNGPSLSVPLAIPLASEATIAGPAMAMSRDGSLLAVVAPDSLGSSKLVVHGLNGSRDIAVEADAIPVAFSPDGQSLAYYTFAPVGIRVAPANGGTARVVASTTGLNGLTWLDDSTIAFSIRGTLARTVIGRTGWDTLPGATAATRFLTSPWAVTRDLVLVQSRTGNGPAEIGVYSIAGAGFRSFSIRGTAPKYVEPGLVLFLNDGTLWAVEVDPRTVTPRGPPRAVVDGQSGGRVVSYGVSSTGVLAVRRSTTPIGRRLIIRERAGGAVREVRSERGLYRSVRFSPDGEQIVFSRALRASMGGDLYTVSVHGGSTVRITSDSIYLAPEWSRDGKRILFATLWNPDNRRSFVLAMDAAGGSAPDTLLSRPYGIFEIEAEPDGQRLLLREDAGSNNRDVVTATFRHDDSARPERATRFDERGIALSPDGEWYLFTTNEANRSDVYVARVGGGGARWPVSRAGGSEPRWARNGEVFYRTPDSVFTTRITLGAVPQIEPPRAVFADHSYFVGLESVWDVSPDGKRFLFVEADDGKTTLQLMTNWIQGWRRP